MFGRLLSYMKTMGTGSMRKRLYTRLAGGAALLVLTVFAIAQAQRMSASRQTAVAAQVDEGIDDVEHGDEAHPRTARTPQPIPGAEMDNESPVALNPPSTFAMSDSAGSSYSLADDTDDGSNEGDYQAASSADRYGGSGGRYSGDNSRFSGRSSSPIGVASAPPYGDRYAATDRYQASSSSAGQHGNSSGNAYGVPVSPATSARLGEPGDDNWDDEEPGNDPYEDQEPNAQASSSFADRYGGSTYGSSGSVGGAESRFTGDGYPRTLSPAAHEEAPDSAATAPLDPEDQPWDDEDPDAETIDTETIDTETIDAETINTETINTETINTETINAEAVRRQGVDDSQLDANERTFGASPRGSLGQDEREIENVAEEDAEDVLARDTAISSRGSSAATDSRLGPTRGQGTVRELESAYSGSDSTSGRGAPPASPGLLSSSAPPRELPSTSRGVSGSSAIVGGAAVTAAAAAAVPGTRDLEGTQTPSVAIEKFAPQEVQVGQAADFEIVVTNVGRTPAHEVVVMDRIPQGTVLNDTEPAAERSGDLLTWRLGTLQPGSEVVLKMNVTPETEGDIGSVAEVAFRAQATARTVSTRPEVVVDVRVADQVLVGEALSLVIMVRNEGTGAARGVVIEEDVPEGFFHPAGRELENEIGLLRPNETKTLELRLEAQRPGTYRNVVRIRDVGNTDLVREQEIEITAPQLEVAIKGPRLRYVERQATYDIAIRNVGTASARRVELMTNLPRGMKFISANKLGQYDARQHAVYWRLEELPPGKEGSVSLVTLPTSPGEQIIQVEGTADLGVADMQEIAVKVEGIAELHFTITDSADPIEVGSDTTYQIAVVNQGDKEDRNITLVAALPEEILPTSAEGPTEGTVSGQRVEFDPVPRLAPGERIVFQIRARGQKSGDARFRVQLSSEEAPKPVVKEESTRVYAD